MGCGKKLPYLAEGVETMNNAPPQNPDPNNEPVTPAGNTGQPGDAPGELRVFYGSTSWSDDANMIDVFIDGPVDTTIRPMSEMVRRHLEKLPRSTS